MQSTTIVLILLAAVVSLAVVLWQYHYRSGRKPKQKIILSACRFVAIFIVFLLLINPEFIKHQFKTEKANLVLLMDNSASLRVTGGTSQAADVAAALLSNRALSEKFRVNSYSFGGDLKILDSLSFTEKTTNITRALSSVNEVYSTSPTAIVLVTDGNQTLGEDYEFYNKNEQQAVYPLVLGDTTHYADIGIDQLNINKFAFLKNKFPIEVFISYHGEGTVTSQLSITLGSKSIYRENVVLNQTANTKVITTLATALSVGINQIRVSLTPLKGERNTENNTRTSAVEVVDEKTEVAIVSDILHPDLGALKKAIEFNEQRTVTLLKPNAPQNELESKDVFILYQPTPAFREIYKYIDEKKANRFTITGTRTNWDFLNRVQNSFEKNNSLQSEEVSPVLNPAFSLFDISGFSITDFPPLQDDLGDLLITKISEIILGQKIKGIETNEPLLALIENGDRREAVLFGENVWKWRAQAYRNQQDFRNFDDLIGKIILYLAGNTGRSRLSLDYQKVYQGNNEAMLTATYFDKSYVFDGNANISVYLKNDATDLEREVPMLLMNGYYKADLNNFPPGTYTFTVRARDENLSQSGTFTILDYDVEKQFVSSDVGKLQRLASTAETKLYFPSEAGQLIADLNADPRYVPIQKGSQNIVPLIDFKILLWILAAALTAEWFIRKYNGLT